MIFALIVTMLGSLITSWAMATQHFTIAGLTFAFSTYLCFQAGAATGYQQGYDNGEADTKEMYDQLISMEHSNQ